MNDGGLASRTDGNVQGFVAGAKGRLISNVRPPNDLELSRAAARATANPFSRKLEGKARSNFALASRLRSGDLSGGPT